MGQLLIRVKTWGDYTVAINRSSWDYKMLVSKCVSVCHRRSSAGHTPHWPCSPLRNVSPKSLFKRFPAILYLCPFSQINTTQLLLTTWQKLWVEILNQGHVPLWVQRIFLLINTFCSKMKLLSPRMLSSPFAFIIHPRTHVVRELFYQSRKSGL